MTLLFGQAMLNGNYGGLSAIRNAQSATGAGGPGTSLVAKVASILGIDQQKVEDAFAQAQKDMEAERLDSQLRALVSDGKLTQQQPTSTNSGSSPCP